MGSKLFNVVKGPKAKRNKFDLSHERKMSFNMGDIIPTLVQEVVPGDSFRISSETMMRLAPMLAPIMHRCNVTTHFFFVPNRLIWNEWEDFITGGKDGNLAPVSPYFDYNQLKVGGLVDSGTLGDYLGLPTRKSTDPVFNSYRVSCLPFRAYQLVYNEYYRDQNLSDPIDFSLASGEIYDPLEVERLASIRKRCWEKDYFTSCLPWSQRGASANIPMRTEISYLDKSYLFQEDGTAFSGDATVVAGQEGGIPPTYMKDSESGNFARVENIDDITGLTAVNDLRKAVRLQEWLERAARGGHRYIEQIMSHFGVRSSDARLQRPEFLGGGIQPIVISEVLNTVGAIDTDTFAPQGNMTGHGISVGGSNGFSKFFEEHGFIIGVVSVLPKTAYQQGLNRMWKREDKFDYFWPEFANLGEQEVRNSEVYLQNGGAAINDAAFGYQSRYAEYKYKESSVHGDFRNTLNFWHMGRIFDTPPSLNEEFVNSDPTHRIFAVEDESYHKLWCQIYNKVDAIRPMPFFGTPIL